MKQHFPSQLIHCLFFSRMKEPPRLSTVSSRKSESSPETCIPEDALGFSFSAHIPLTFLCPKLADQSDLARPSLSCETPLPPHTSPSHPACVARTREGVCPLKINTEVDIGLKKFEKFPSASTRRHVRASWQRPRRSADWKCDGRGRGERGGAESGASPLTRGE